MEIMRKSALLLHYHSNNSFVKAFPLLYVVSLEIMMNEKFKKSTDRCNALKCNYRVNIRKVPALISTNKNFTNIIQVITTKSDGIYLTRIREEKSVKSLLHEYPYHGNVVFYAIFGQNLTFF